MKKSLIFLVLLTALSAGALAVCHGWVNAAQDRVEIQEIVVEGEPSAAEGLSVLYQTGAQSQRLFWDTTFSLGGELEPESVFRFVPDGDFYGWQGGDHVSLYCASGDFASGGGSILDSASDRWYRERDMLIEPVRDVANRTADGEKRTETLRLADYYDFYPLALSVQLEVNQGLEWDNWNMYQTTAEELQKFEDYFRVPVSPASTVTVTVEKSADGKSMSVESSTSSVTREDFLIAFGLVSEDGVYLLVDAGGGTSAGDSPLAVAKGIHFVPITGREKETPNSSWGHLILDFDSIRLLHPVTSGELMDFRWSSDRSQLMVYTRENEKLVLTIVDASTGQVDQCLELLDWPAPEDPEEQTWLTVADDGPLHAAEISRGRFCAILEEDGRYVPILTYNSGEAYPITISEQGTKMAWDGERLAMALAITENSPLLEGLPGDTEKYPVRQAVGVRLEVWTTEGMQYRGFYEDLPARDPSSFTRDYYHAIIRGGVAAVTFSDTFS